jgi:3-deoxy-D-manno-octulosonate 8-phosphate phosphatase (KDO 8-P phosphatase)
MENELLAGIELVAFDFDGVFTDNAVYVNQEGVESVRCSRSDGIGIDRIREKGVKVVIVSTEVNPVVSARAKKLKIDCYQAIKDKAEAILTICKEMNVPIEKTMFVGNDINDIPAFKVVGFPVCVFDSYPEIYPYTTFKTLASGGHGAVREICDMIYFAKSLNERI